MIKQANKPIGVFDSGVGGLTVLSALKKQLPHENFIYLGDTARLPYGTKSKETVIQYAKHCVQLLADLDVKYCVIACNTASSVAISGLTKAFPDLPILGVVEPGADAIAAKGPGQALVLATDSTTQWHAYQQAVAQRSAEINVVEWACPLFVSLVEEGWTQGALVESIVHEVLKGISHQSFDTVTLGCTHFPMLKAIISRVFPQAEVIDSSNVVAQVLKKELVSQQLENNLGRGDVQFLATDSIERFSKMASRFLGIQLPFDEVILVHDSLSLPAKKTG